MAIGLTLTHIVDSKTVIEDFCPLSLDSTNINVYIEIESPHGLENITLAMGNATASSLKAKNGSSATGSVTHTHTLCGLTSTLNRTLLLPATATGDFFNSTLPPVPTGSVRVSSQTNSLPFSSVSSGKNILEASLFSFGHLQTSRPILFQKGRHGPV
jgi:hypothetical protein